MILCLINSSSKTSDHAERKHLRLLVSRKSENWIRIEQLRRANVPTRSRVLVVVVHVVSLNDEAAVDAMRQISLEHIAARVRLRRNDVVLGLREVEPILAAVIELKAKFGPILVLERVTSTGIEHVSVVIHGRLEWIRAESAKRRR